MTKERTKELAVETAQDIFEDAFRDMNYLQNRLVILIDIVAAEARQEAEWQKGGGDDHRI